MNESMYAWIWLAGSLLCIALSVGNLTINHKEQHMAYVEWTLIFVLAWPIILGLGAFIGTAAAIMWLWYRGFTLLVNGARKLAGRSGE